MKTMLVHAALAGLMLVGAAACSERESEAETANIQAEVSTTAPESEVSNEELNAAAVNAVLDADPTGAPYIEDGAGGTTGLPPVKNAQ